MTRTSSKFRNHLQQTLFRTALVVAGLMAAATTVEAGTRVNDTNLNWSKRQFINYCHTKKAPVICLKQRYRCSCDDKNHRFIWWRSPPNNPPSSHVIRRLLVPASIVLGDGGRSRPIGKSRSGLQR